MRTQENEKTRKTSSPPFFGDSPPFRFSLETASVKEEEARESEGGRLKVDKGSN